MKKLLALALLATFSYSNEFRINQKIEEISIYYKDIKYLCIGGTLQFIKDSTYKNTLIKSVENPRTGKTYKCELNMNDMYTDKRMIEIKD